jgi:fatty aldehyde-generating acyl-ACP reductase
LTKFAFVVHPISPRDIARKYPLAKYFPDFVLEPYMRMKKPAMVSEITGVRSVTGAETTGWFIGCPLTPALMTKKMDIEDVYDRIVRCTEIAAELGAELIGLGAFTSVVGDGGITIAKRSPIAVTTGNSYTVATAIQGTEQACEMLGIVPREATLAVVGATGSIGKTCAQVLGRDFGRTVLVGRDQARTEAVVKQIGLGEATTDVERIRLADVVVTVTSSDSAVILPEHLRPGAIVCDVARPRDVSVRVAKERPDVLVIEGGVVAVPGDVDFHFDFGFPAKTAYACMSETMMLALEGRPESFTLGKDVSVEQVEETFRLADKHGFKLAGFRSFEKAVSQEAIDRARAARERNVPSVLSAAKA